MGPQITTRTVLVALLVMFANVQAEISLNIQNQTSNEYEQRSSIAYQSDKKEIKRTSSRYGDYMSYDIEIISKSQVLTFKLDETGLNTSKIYRVEDSLEHKYLGCYNSSDEIKLQTNSAGKVNIRVITQDPDQSLSLECDPVHKISQNSNYKYLSIVIVILILFVIITIFVFTFSQLWKKKKSEDYLELLKNIQYDL